MFRILEKELLNPTVARIVVYAPLIARKAEAGQFIILRATENSERMPLTISAYDREHGTIALIFQIVGAGTTELNSLNKGDSLQDCVGPLWRTDAHGGVEKGLRGRRRASAARSRFPLPVSCINREQLCTALSASARKSS